MAAAGLPAWFAHETFTAALLAEEKKPGEKFRMGSIGNGSIQSRGRAIANDALNTKQAEYVAVCDVDKSHREKAAKMLGADVKAYEDFRELLDRKDIDAVTIAVPDHWHALIAVEALKKGKHVYGEKPLALTIAEGRAICNAVDKYKKTFQVGSQQRSDARFRLACELVRNGRIGKIKTVETRIGANPKSPELPKAKAPEGLNWDFWLGPTPLVDYVELPKPNARPNDPVYTRCHYEFRWWYEYSGGKMTDWGAHHNDIAQWGLGMDESGPIAVEGEGTEPGKGNHYNCHPEFKATYSYANGAKLVCSHKQLEGAADPKGNDNGVLFVGENGWIFVNRGKIEASDKKLLEEPLPGNATRLYVSTNHMGNFFDCIRSGKPTICTAEIGHHSVNVCHLGNIAIRSGKKLKWDPKAEQFIGDDEANKWLSRPMRAPWKLEV
jgi:predicted dehydrogenase